MGVLYDTLHVSIVTQITWMKGSLQVKNIAHMYVICVVKNGSMWICSLGDDMLNLRLVPSIIYVQPATSWNAKV